MRKACNGTHEADDRLPVDLLDRQGDTDSQTVKSMSNLAHEFPVPPGIIP